MNDPLDAFRRRNEPRANTEPKASEGPQPYIAFEAINKARLVRIHASDGNIHGVPCSDIREIVLGAGERQIFVRTLVTNFLVTGERLYSVADALWQFACTQVRPYDAAHFLPPEKPDAAFIERVEVEVIRSGPARERPLSAVPATDR